MELRWSYLRTGNLFWQY